MKEGLGLKYRCGRGANSRRPVLPGYRKSAIWIATYSSHTIGVVRVGPPGPALFCYLGSVTIPGLCHPDPPSAERGVGRIRWRCRTRVGPAKPCKHKLGTSKRV